MEFVSKRFRKEWKKENDESMICKSFIITLQFLDGDLKTACPSVNDPIRPMPSPSAVRTVGFQPLPTSCITFEASVTMTYKICNSFKFFIY